MPSTRRKGPMIASLAFALLANLTSAPSGHAGPISDMLARHRQNRQMRLPPMDKPFSNKPVRDLNVSTTSLKDRFKKRFSLQRAAPDGVIPLNPDLGANRSY